MVAAAKATVPTVSDQACAMQLSQCAKNLAAALAELRTATQKVSNFACRVLGIIPTGGGGWWVGRSTGETHRSVWEAPCTRPG